MLWIFDLDGVVYRGKTLLSGAKKTLNILEERGEEICFLSNNSTQSRRSLQAKLVRMGIKVKQSQLFPSSYLAAIYFSQNPRRRKARLMVIGENGLDEELRGAGLKAIQESDTADYVLVGMDRKVDFPVLCQAHRAVLKGARLIATNTDATYPVEGETIPGAGVIVRALEVSTGKRALVLGKPHPFGLRMIMKVKGYKDPRQIVLVGDRLETDIATGKKVGVITVLVLSGISNRQEAKAMHPRRQPDYVISSLRELPALKFSHQ